jgi:flagellar motor switch protein FliN
MPEERAPSKTEIGSLDLLRDVPLLLSVELGRCRMPVSEVLRLGPGSVVELQKSAGESLDIYVNERLVARGEAVMVGERYGVRITEVQPTAGAATSLTQE